MLLGDWLRTAEKHLKSVGIATARLDCLVLLEDALQKDRSYLLAHPEAILPPSALATLNKQITRRQGHEPLAYIRGKSEFYGREFIVSKDTLEPRPESETMITLLKKIINSQNPSLIKDGPFAEGENVKWRIVDVGTGSGCLGITAKLECSNVRVFGTDISPACLKIARQNAKKLNAEIKFYQGDLLSSLPSSAYNLPTALACNLPYVPDSHTINSAAMHEPNIAIFGGPDGLDFYRRLFVQVTKLAKKPEFVLTESLPFQHVKLSSIAQRSGYSQQAEDDFIQVFQKS